MLRNNWPLSYMGRSAAVIDPYFSSTVLLLGFEGSDGSTTITDESAAARGNATAVVNQAQIDTAQFKFGASSLLLDGSGDRVDWADSDDWLFGSGAFTVETWVRFNSLTGFQTIASQWNNVGTARSWMLDFPGSANNVLRFGYSEGLGDEHFIQGAWTPSANTWYHIVVDRSGNVFRIYADGVMITSTTAAVTLQNSTEGLRIGSLFISGANTNFFNGWIDELRITKGVARYASDSGYAVPTAAFPRS
jgi:hypothetical protein